MRLRRPREPDQYLAQPPVDLLHKLGEHWIPQGLAPDLQGQAQLAAVLGPPGIALGVVIVFLFGNPISGVAAAPELLPEPWGAVGQLLPPGAGVSLVRSAAFFDGAGSAAPLWTLAAWAILGLVLLALGRPFGHALPAQGGSTAEAGTATGVHSAA